MVITILTTILLVANIVSLISFAIDKINSKRRRYRIRESSLLLLAFFGPFGALASMLLFRHKTRKIKFILVPIFTIVQLTLLISLYHSDLNFLNFQIPLAKTVYFCIRAN